MTKEMAANGGQGLKRGEGPCRPPNGRQGPVSFLQRPKIYCDIFAEGFGNRVRIIMKFTEGVGCQFWWAHGL